MSFNFELLLTLLVIFSGLICLLDVIVLKSQRGTEQAIPKYVEYARSYFPVLLIVLIIRSFIVEPFHIPSGSLEPTLIRGDFIFANKYDYGLRLPVTHTKILNIGEPKVGNIALMRSPFNKNIDLIKRMIGVPGDKISYINKVLYINGVEQPQKDVGMTTYYTSKGDHWPVDKREETINGINHFIYVRPNAPAINFSITVPPKSYFVMGDNRDTSYDSRYWGFVPQKDLIGKAFMIWFSWSNKAEHVRWERIGARINQRQ